MPRPLVFGNGSLLVCFDRQHRARDLFWPNVGYPNHLLGHINRVGVWCGGAFSWVESDSWQRILGYDGETSSGLSLWRSWDLGLEIEVRENVAADAPAFVRSMLVRDLRGTDRLVKLFFTQNFILGQSDVGNTAFYEPFAKALVHYRGPVYVAVGCGAENGEMEEYATGLCGFGGLEGTWRDAEDGSLSLNPIAQGSVDSTIGCSVNLPAQGQARVHYSLSLGSNLEEATRLHMTVSKSVDSLIEHTKSESTKWLSHCSRLDLGRLSERAQSVFWRSLLTIRTQCDHNGAVLAANDSDILQTNRATYSYCWPRDASLVTATLVKLGYPEFLDRYFSFCAGIVSAERPYFLQKYRSDGSLGASWHPWIIQGESVVPFQQDETALTLYAMSKAEPEVAKSAWDKFGKYQAEFLLAHRTPSGLPSPSWDPWEERYGTHFFTVCAVVAGLDSCSILSGDSKFKVAADQMVEVAESDFVDGAGVYMRCLESDQVADSAVLGGLLLSDRLWARADESASFLQRKLAVSTGGLARYEKDYYFRAVESEPGNPWVISTMWMSQWLSQIGDTDGALQHIEWAAERSETTGILAEQYHPLSGAPQSVSPLTWSHSQYIEAVLALERALENKGGD